MKTVDFHNQDGSVTTETVPDCCRCGMCCLSAPCGVGVLAYGLSPNMAPGMMSGMAPQGRCPGLSFDDKGNAECVVCENSGGAFDDVFTALGTDPHSDEGRKAFMGFFVGCCLKARCIDKFQHEHNFATLRDSTKRKLAELARGDTD